MFANGDIQEQTSKYGRYMGLRRHIGENEVSIWLCKDFSILAKFSFDHAWNELSRGGSKPELLDDLTPADFMPDELEASRMSIRVEEI